MYFTTFKKKIKNTLIWSQKYTQTDMLYLAKGGAWLTFSQFVSAITAFITSVIFANFLSKETYGTYKYFLSIFGILSITTLLGMGGALINAVARGFEGSIKPVIKTRIHWGLLGALACLLVALFYFNQSNTTLAVSFLIGAIFIPFADALGAYDFFLQGKKLFNTSAQYSIISQIISTVILIVTLIITKNIIFIILAYLVPMVGLNWLFLKITLKKYSFNDKIDSQTISYGKHLSLMGIIDVIANYLDRLLIFHYLGAAEVAIYSFIIAPPELIKGLLKNLSLLLLPKFSQRTIKDIKKTIWKKTFIFGLIIFAITIFYILLAPIIFNIFFKKYSESILYSQFFSLSLITAVSILPYSALQSQMAKRSLYIYSYFSSIIQIVSLLILVYLYGIWGAILAKIISRTINLGIIFWLLKKSS